MTFREFECRCAETPDLELSPFYWNSLIPETAPGYLMWRVKVFLDDLREWRAASPPLPQEPT